MSNFGKRRDGPVGRRGASRERILLETTLDTVGSARSAMLLDVSQTGAKLEGDDLPPKGQLLLLRVAGISLFGEVTWRKGRECGVQFDDGMSEVDTAALKAESRSLRAQRISADEQRAAEDWQNGFAR